MKHVKYFQTAGEMVSTCLVNRVIGNLLLEAYERITPPKRRTGEAFIDVTFVNAWRLYASNPGKKSTVTGLHVHRVAIPQSYR
jgi:hypothetical protein